jgi:hypothetical protein
MALGTAISLAFLPVSADETDTDDATVDVVDADKTTDDTTDDEESTSQYVTISDAISKYLTTEYTSREEKLATMTLKLSKGNLQLYCDTLTGEIAIYNTVTTQILLSNPYDVSTVNSDSVKADLLSQISVTFEDLENNGATRTLNSYTDSATYGQISVKNVKNGIRVEYTLGKASSKKLMPYWIEASRFETMILANITDSYKMGKTLSYYTRKDANTAEVEAVKNEIFSTYSCTKNTYSKTGVTPNSIRTEKDEDGNTVYITEYTDETGTLITNSYKSSDYLVIYTVNSEVTASEKMSNTMEGYVKEYAPDYNYEERDYDIELTGYTGNEAANATFRLALEYYLTDDGLEVSLPANGIRYDSDSYRLQYITVLPYMGASSGDFPGYTFIPDGSGTIIRNEDITADGRAYTITGQVYGADFAYHTLTANGKSEVMRMPVFGTIESTGDPFVVDYEYIYQVDEDTGETVVDSDGNPIPENWTVTADEVLEELDSYGDHIRYYIVDEEKGYVLDESTGSMTMNVELSGKTYYVLDEDGNRAYRTNSIYDYTYVNQGFVAIIEEGESLCYITSNHGGNVLHKYNSTYVTVYPESSDTYNLADTISVGQDAEWTVVSERKYTGAFKILYIMVSDLEGSEYAGSYMGMALAYRNYLEKNGVLSLIDDAAADIPLYIESFGMIETDDVIMTIPVYVDTPLTTFDDVETMYQQLSAKGINNVNFRLTGFTNGGASVSTAPTSVKFEKVLGGNSGYQQALTTSAGRYGLYANFDFSNVQSTTLLDGFSYKKYAARTIDNRYARKRSYDATYQSYQYIGSVCVSASAYEVIFEKFSKAMSKFEGITAISAGTLGSDLNTDFDEDDPYNREDSKEYTIEFLKSLSETYGNVMVDGGNAYTWSYVSDILNVSLDSSRYLRASQSIPFMGIILHGSIQIAGKPTNMQGDLEYEILKIVENGASPYYTLSYQNTSELKDNYDLSKYYSVNFGIWLDDLVDTYTILNEALKDVQTSQIMDHQFLFGNRVLDDDEQVSSSEELAEAIANYAEEYNAALLKALRDAYRIGLISSLDYTVDENGLIIAPDDFDMETFTFVEFEDYYTASIDTTIDDYSIVYEQYANGVQFILNYNSFGVTVELNGQTYTIGSYGFVKLDATNTIVMEH